MMHNDQRRIRVLQRGTGDPVGKLVVVPDNCSFSQLMLLCGRKLGLKATQGIESDFVVER